MADLEHTPGDWKVEVQKHASGNWTYVIREANPAIGPGSHIATANQHVLDDRHEWSLIDGNAALLAAAPALLKALIEVLPVIDGTKAHTAKIIADAEAAIKLTQEPLYSILKTGGRS